MFELPQNETEMAQFVGSLIVSGYTAKAVAHAADRHTNLDPNGVPVKTTGLVAGLYVANKLKPHTDALIARGMDRYKSWKQERKTKNTAK